MNPSRFLSAVVLSVVFLSGGIADSSAFGMRGDGKRGEMGGGLKGKAAAVEVVAEEGGGPDPSVRGAFGAMVANLDDMRKHGLFDTGLKPVYPAEASCLEINSAFGATTRGDGSRRQYQFFRGYHSGADIPAREGTPIVAMANGTVIEMKAGENIGGLGLILQHSPEDTGLPVWTYTEYKHLMEPPALELGQRVRMGEVIAKAGATGTASRHYGPGGHSHLHLSAWYSAGKEYRAGKMFVPVDGHWMDPMALLRGMPVDSREAKALSDEAKNVPIPYKTSDGRIVPAGARAVWPFGCPPK